MATENTSKPAADWKVGAACRGGDTNAFFMARAAAQRQATRICRGCAVRYECLGEALDDRVPWGVWGGLTESERRQVLRRFPQVTNWRQLLRRAWAQELAATRRVRTGTGGTP